MVLQRESLVLEAGTARSLRRFPVPHAHHVNKRSLDTPPEIMWRYGQKVTVPWAASINHGRSLQVLW